MFEDRKTGRWTPVLPQSRTSGMLSQEASELVCRRNLILQHKRGHTKNLQEPKLFWK